MPQGYYNLGDMLGMVARRNAEIGVCGTCMDARGIAESELADGAWRGTLARLTVLTTWENQVLVF